MKVVIAGAGPAGITVAETLRLYDRKVEIDIISSEPYPPYSPPAMLESFITGQNMHFWKGEDITERLGVNYISGKEIQTISTNSKNIKLNDNKTLNYDALVLAAGARLHSPIEGSEKPGIYNLKSLASTAEIFEKVRQGKAKSALIVGAGFIGVEIGVVLADMGVKVNQLVRSRVLRLSVDPEVSGIVQKMMQDRGVNVIKGSAADAKAFIGNRRTEGVQTKSGTVHKADIIIAASGIKPNIEFLADSKIKTDHRGVLVNKNLRTNFKNIYAAGDIAVTSNRVTNIKAVHGNLPNAVAQGEIVAQNILGQDISYDGSDTMNSLKHLGIKMIVAGQDKGEEELINRSDKSIRKIYLKDNQIVGFCLVGDVRAAGIYRTLMNRRDNISTFKDKLERPGFGIGYASKFFH